MTLMLSLFGNMGQLLDLSTLTEVKNHSIAITQSLACVQESHTRVTHMHVSISRQDSLIVQPQRNAKLSSVRSL